MPLTPWQTKLSLRTPPPPSPRKKSWIGAFRVHSTGDTYIYINVPGSTCTIKHRNVIIQVLNKES